MTQPATLDQRCALVVLTLACLAQPAALDAAQKDAANEEGAAESEEKPKFDIFEYQISGNTVLPTLAIEKAVYPFLGPGKSIDDVQKAREALEKAYQSAGYLTVFVDIPEQTVEGGIVRL